MDTGAVYGVISARSRCLPAEGVAMDEGKKSWGETVLGWFVVRDEQGRGDGAGSDLAAEGTTDAPSVDPVGEVPPAPDGVVDFDAVFSAYGIDAEARDRLAKADGLLGALPAGADAAVKRHIVEASLKAFGIPVERIIETACEQIQALDAYPKKGGAALQSFCDEAQRRIVALEGEISSIRSAMNREIDGQRKTLESCNRKKLEVQRVLEFFGPEAVGRVVRESPRLIDPSVPGTGGARPAR